MCIGVTDAVPQLQYWEQFGYRIGKIGELSASVTGELYGVSSKVRSLRLDRQDADSCKKSMFLCSGFDIASPKSTASNSALAQLLSAWFREDVNRRIAN